MARVWRGRHHGEHREGARPGARHHSRPERSEEHTSELQSHSDLPSFPTRRSSDLLKTQGLGAWKYGRIEARMQIPRGQGLWPAFWMLGDDIATVGWPGCGEVDIMENIGKEPARVHGTIHGPRDRKSTRLNSSHTVISPLSLHDALPIS